MPGIRIEIETALSVSKLESNPVFLVHELAFELDCSEYLRENL